MAREFVGKKTIFADKEKSDRILLDGNNIIYFLDNRIKAHNLSNYKIVFNVEHKYNPDNYKGMFKIRNNLVILEEDNDGILLVGVHNIKSGIKIKSKTVDLDNIINYSIETPQNIILKIGKKLYVLDPFSDNNILTIMEKGDLVLKLLPDNNPMKKWEKGFYIVGGNSIYIFDSSKLINKITTDKKIIKVVVDGDIFYWSTLIEDEIYINRYILSHHKKEDIIFKYDSPLDYNIKHGKIFLYGTYHSDISDSFYHYTIKFTCVDLKTKKVEYSVVDNYVTSKDKMFFSDYIDNKIIYLERSNTTYINIYDLEDKNSISHTISYDLLYLGTTSTNKIVFRDKESLIVLS